MAEITSPIILDSTGKEIRDAIRALCNSSGGTAVLYTPQNLTVAQRAQARENIGFWNGIREEQLSLSPAITSPDGETFEYTANDKWSANYFVAHSVDAVGGTLNVECDTTQIEQFEFTPYLFKDGVPYKIAQKNNVTSQKIALPLSGEVDFSGCWVDPGEGSGGYFTVKPPFTIQIPDGCELLISIRINTNGPSVLPETSQYSLYYADDNYIGHSINNVVSGKISYVAEGSTGENSVLFTKQELSDEQKAQARANIGAAKEQTSGADEEKLRSFTALFNNSGDVESFVYFTDPHLLGFGNTPLDEIEANMQTFLGCVKDYYDATPTSFVICGGDWLNDSDTQEQACFKMGMWDSYMRKNFHPYYPVLGNHDTNYQGVDHTGEVRTGRLTNDTLRNLMFREHGNLYYSFKGNNTTFYVFESGIDWVPDMNDFRWEQVDWFAKKIIEDDAAHSALAIHIFSGSDYVAADFAENVLTVAQAYNNRDWVTLNGVTYDFTTATGRVEFMLAGHTHEDNSLTKRSIPVVVTSNLKRGMLPTFDLCLADYTNKKLYLERVGAGNSRRIVTLGSGATIPLPVGYTQLSYIKVSGTQYIKTNIVPTIDLVAEIDNFIRPASKVAWTGYIGSQTADNSADSWLFRCDSGVNRYAFDINNRRWRGPIYSDNGTVTMTNGMLALDGVNINENSYEPVTSFSATYPLWLFTINQAGTAFRNATDGGFGRLRFSNSNGLIADFVACKNPDGEVGLFERVSQTFYGNDGGSDAFIGGDEIN